MSEKLLREILVVGTGPAGLMAALAVARSGHKVVLVGPSLSADDGRTTALMLPAIEFLDDLGVTAAVNASAAPLKTMRIIDMTSRLIRSPSVTFRSSEIGKDHFGLNIPNRSLITALQRAIEDSSDIEWRQTTIASWKSSAQAVEVDLADGSNLTALLAIAADGRNSSARSAVGINATSKIYGQSALVLNFTHSRPHSFISTEFHTETGPFTQVPLVGNRSSLVWVVTGETATELAALDDDTLSVRIEERMQSMLGKVRVETGRQIYPLSATLPSRFANDRVALVGEAAHVFPPIGAQGLNLGIRDVQDVVRVIAEHQADPGAPTAMSRYDRLRRPDILSRSAGVNLLNRSLLSDLLPAQLARGFGLSVLDGISPLRAFVMRESLKPGSGFPGLAADLRKQVRR